MEKIKSIINNNLKLRRLPQWFLWVWAASLLFIFIYFIVKGKSNFWLELWFLVEMIILTLFTRTIGFKRMLSVFFQGILISGILTFFLYKFLAIVGADVRSALINGWIIGPAEELFKLLPIALAVYLLYKKRKSFPNASDFLILSVLTGSGFSIIEKTFWGEVSFPFTYGPHIGGLYLFPDALGIMVNGRAFGYIGHAAATGLVGMALGIAFYIQRKTKKQWVWAIPALVYIWVSVEHALLNSYYANGTKALLKLGGGLVTPWIFLVFLAAMLIIDLYNLFSWLAKRPQAKQVLKKSEASFFKTLHVYNILATKGYKK
jgi:RsiW-degrading membrane proteinase PrsW (M82 family)